MFETSNAGWQNLTDVIYTDFTNKYLEDIFCESCTPANYKIPNDYVKVNLLSLREGILASLYPKAYLLILSYIIPTVGV